MTRPATILLYCLLHGAIMSVQLEEKDLNEIKQKVLVHLRKELVDNVDPRRYMTFLRSKFVLDERDCDEIKSGPSRHASAEKFFDLLAKKGPTGYDEFCNALFYDKTQLFLLTSMSTTLQLLKAKTKKAKGSYSRVDVLYNTAQLSRSEY